MRLALCKKPVFLQAMSEQGIKLILKEQTRKKDDSPRRGQRES